VRVQLSGSLGGFPEGFKKRYLGMFKCAQCNQRKVDVAWSPRFECYVCDECYEIKHAAERAERAERAKMSEYIYWIVGHAMLGLIVGTAWLSSLPYEVMQ